ncbi:unnamed protein product [Paramecium sonneborni]|uniref:Uncharacterized protein n=1 Tax=Paramecium sonneborni TaxID=65129 RepID=A0A8S1LG54_9CILI|nr:unnamed protein product [Paramecium sonneborni]
MKSLFRYHFINKVSISSINQNTLIPLYKSSISDQKLNNFQQSYVPFKEYFQLVPIFIERYLFDHGKHFVVGMSYSKESNLLQLKCMAHSGLYTKYIVPQNIIPVTFGDYNQSCRFNLFEHTIRVDYDMIYYNNQQNEFYLFDREGKWEEVEIPELSIEKLFDEKKYLNEVFR